MSRTFTLLAVAATLLLCTNAHAFKVDTHVWVGQQVVNDLADDGKLSFMLGDERVNIAINSDIKNAILNNSNEFLIGNLGPDAIPDLLVGQTVNHPGIKDDLGNNIGWQTNDWLEYLLENISYSEKAKSFVYGYMSHAAADVFAHTYINQYAGDIFDLSDETLVEQRHYILETYMANHTPPLKNSLGHAMGAPWQEIYLDNNYAEFVRDTLIYNDEVQSEYWKVTWAYHLAAFYEFRKDVDSLAEDGIWRDIDIAVAKIFAAYYGVSLTSGQADIILDKANVIIDRLYAGSENVQEFSNDLYQSASNFEHQVFYKLSSAVSQMQDVESKWLAKIQDWNDLVNDHAIPGCKFSFDDIFAPGVDTSNPVNPICGLSEDIQNALNVIQQEVVDYKNDMIDRTIEVHNEAQQVADSIHNVANAIIDLHQVVGADTSPIQAVLRGWRSDIDLAMTAYVKATSQSMINTMNPDASALEPITDWFECYHLQMLGLPSPVANCEFRDSLVQIRDSIENIILIIDEATSLGAQVGMPSTRDLHDLRDRMIDEIVNKLKEKVSDQIVDILPPEIQELIVMLDVEVTDAILNEYFIKPETITNPKGLLMIANLSDRIKAEMHLSSGKFDPENYAVAHNAVVLAKLALLNRDEFAQLAQAAGSVDYVQHMGSLVNVVAQAFESIDGNHQWMTVPPPRPNAMSLYPPVTYTYASPMGFVPWQGDMRDKIFRKLFIGPLSPGVDAPSITSMARLVDSDYPYQVCVAHPFPNNIEDKTCTAISLVPILSMMLN